MSRDYVDELKFGNSISQQSARRALPMLVRRAIEVSKKKAPEEPYITCSDLARALDIDFVLVMTDTLNCIARALPPLGSKLGCDIPAITTLVVEKGGRYPGDGIGEFFGGVEPWLELSEQERHRLIEEEWAKVYAFTEWPQVLDALGLSPMAES